ncbi:ankyrin repeat-containing domain protein [Aspergillus cavernicola]|uniref:Ankyrin repeat-containing domain protein n=1 Tax=Aspergillus cavernicola TaxID=176166 RepID=A0ABR4ICA6_9EURO
MAGGGDSPSTVSGAGLEVPEEAVYGLKLVNTVRSQLEETDDFPDLDIIHVVGTSPGPRLSLDTMIGDAVSSRKREFVFQCDVSSLFLGNLIFDVIQYQASQLLEGIVSSGDDDKTSQPVRIFVAYDLGALVVKQAVAIAASKESQWPGVFYSAVQFIYWGCFHRRRTLQDLDTRLWAFLQAHKENLSWASLVTSMSIRALADASVEMTELFLSSRITLRARVVSFYANETEKMGPILDSFTATLGVSTEFAVPKKPDSSTEAPSDLDQMVCYRKDNWASSPEWTALQRLLLPLAHPQHQHASSKPDSSLALKVVESKAYSDWMSMSKSPILYIQGRDEKHSRFLAEQVFLTWQSKLRDKRSYRTPVLSFSFSSHDPARATMDPMICSAMIQILTAFEPQSADSEPTALSDLNYLQRGWTPKDLQNLLLIFVSPRLEKGGLLVLHDADECEPTSRKAFWALVQRLTDMCDLYVRVVVTSRRRLSLLADSDKTSLWHLYDHIEDTALEKPPFPAVLISRLCPSGHGESRVKESLQALASMDQTRLEQTLILIQHHTSWPDIPSSRAWSGFCTLLDQIQPPTSPATVLDRILRVIPDQVGMQWALQWLVYGHRPFRRSELACLFCQRNRGDGDPSFSNPTPLEVEEFMQLLKSWLSAVVEFGHDQIRVRNHVWDILHDDSPAYLWNEIKPVAHQTILEFLSLYLTAPENRSHLSEMYDTYMLLYNADEKHASPSVLPDGEDFIFYAVTAFPYHLERNPQSLQELEHLFRSPAQPLMPWAKMFWAMSNPFSRPLVEAIDSAVSVLLSRENLDSSFRNALKALKVTSAAPTDSPKVPRELDDAAAMGALLCAVSVGHEEAALKHMHRIIIRWADGRKDTDKYGDTTPSEASDNIFWPSTLLWRATWLNMDRLITLLLHNGMCPDPEDFVSARYPSPLYVASILGHSRVAQALLQAGANSRVLRSGTDGVLYVAAAKGHSDAVRALVAKDPELLELDQPLTPLYSACSWGKWESVKTLLNLGARPDFNPDSDGWNPLIVAAKYGYARIVRTLLENGADPNLAGPDEENTALSFAAMRGQSVECLRALLEYGADPNHDLLQPPLLVEICRTPDINSERKIALLEPLRQSTPPINIDSVSSYGVTGLMWAATNGDTVLVEWLLAHDINVNTTDNKLHSALYYAVANGHRPVVQRLLERKPPTNNLNRAGETLLQLAVEIGVDLVGMLLDADANPELENGKGQTVLNSAVVQENPEAVKLLIKRGLDIHHRDSAGWCPIHDACGHSPNADIARILAEAGARLTDTTTGGWSPLQLAAADARPDIVAVLLEFHGALDIEQRCNEDGETPLIKAAISGDLECIRRLLQAGADVNAQCPKGWTALMHAVCLDEPYEVVSFLLSQPRLDISLSSKNEGAALHIASSYFDIAVVNKLLDNGADVNQLLPGRRPTPLMSACVPCKNPQGKTRGEILDRIDQVVRTLVERGADLHVQYTTPVSTLLCAGALGSGPSTINYLVSKGLSLQEKGCLNRLPIHYAAVHGRDNFEAVFLSDRDLLSEDIARKNALHWAAQFGRVQTVEMILAHAPSPEERRKRINHRDIDGWTALCWALRPITTIEHPEIHSEPYEITRTLQVLIEGGADAAITCRMGREDETFTVLELAKLHDASEDIITLLSDAAAATAHLSSEGKATPTCTTTRPIRPYKTQAYDCDTCHNTISGPVWECTTCFDFDICKKCHGQIDLYHRHLKQENGDPHTFKLLVEAPPEIQEPSEAGAVASPGNRSKAGEEGHKGSDGSKHEGDGNTVIVDDTMEAIMNFSVDEDFSDPKIEVENNSP